MSSIVKQYEEWTPEMASDESDEAKKASQRGAFMTLKQGKNIVRIMPPIPGSRSPFHVVHQHFLKDAEGKTTAFECPERGKKGPARQECPVCAHASALEHSANPLDKSQANALWPATKAFCNVIDRADEEAGPKLLTLSKRSYMDLLEAAKDPNIGGNFTNPETGCDIIVTKTGEGLDTRYKVDLARRSSLLSADEEITEVWLAAMADLSSKVKVLTIDEMVSLLPVASPRGRLAAPVVAPRRGAGFGGKPVGRTAQDIIDSDDDLTQ